MPRVVVDTAVHCVFGPQSPASQDSHRSPHVTLMKEAVQVPPKTNNNAQQLSVPVPKHPSQPPDIAGSAAVVEVTMCVSPDAEDTGNDAYAKSSTFQMLFVEFGTHSFK